MVNNTDAAAPSGSEKRPFAEEEAVSQGDASTSSSGAAGAVAGDDPTFVPIKEGAPPPAKRVRLGEEGAKPKKTSKGQPREWRPDLNQGPIAKSRKGGEAGVGAAAAAEAEAAKARANGTGAADDEGEKEARLPKRKVCVFFGYCGIGYSGLQINPGVKTIEGDIFDAFCAAGAVSADNAINPAKVGLQRAARTDRGVHAAGNLLTLKLILDPPTAAAHGGPGGPGLVAHVNSLLPPFIRVWGLTRVQGSFNARTSCDSRMYEYLLPTHVFIPPKPGSSMYNMFESFKKEGESLGDPSDPASLSYLLDHPFWEEHGLEQTFTADINAKRSWRIPSAHLERIRAILKGYEGSHNFHNFTVGKEFKDRSARRFMKELTVSEPKVINQTEWVSIKFHGQSFMLHQIRKMIGLMVLMARSPSPTSFIAETFGPSRIHCPKAPGLGLLLEEPLFGGYNTRIERNNVRIDRKLALGAAEGNLDPNNDEAEQKREDVQFDQFRSNMETFKQTFIYDRIVKEEEESEEFAKWLNYLDVAMGTDFEFLNPRGTIPAGSIVKPVKSEAEKLAAKAERASALASMHSDVNAAAGSGAGASADAAAYDPESDDEEAALKGNAAELEG